MNERPQVVSQVARNSRWETVEVILYVGFIWYVTHPTEAEQLGEKLKAWKAQALHRLSVWQTQGAIRSLPEVDPPS